MAAKDIKKTIIIQTNGDYDVADITEKAKQDYKKNNKAALKDINIYIKPEEKMVYYTANSNKISGEFGL